MPSIGTAMSYRGQIEPFFSTPRIRPYGAVVGVAEEQDNERTLRETVHIGVQYSDYLRSLEGVPAQPSDLRVRLDGGGARSPWRDNAPGADGYEVEYVWRYSPGRFRRQAVEGPHRGGSPARVHGTGDAHIDFVVRAIKGDERSLRSSEVLLVVPGDPVAAPSDVSRDGRALGLSRARCALDRQLGQRIGLRRAASPGRRSDSPAAG